MNISKLAMPLCAIIFLTGCGMSEKDKIEISQITCNIIEATRNMDAAQRIKEVNAAREQMGEERFLGSDQDIKASVRFGICDKLVRNDPDYQSTLTSRRAAQQRILEGERIAKEKRAEEERIAREKRAEEERIAKENAMKKAIENTKTWIANNESFIKSRELKPKLLKVDFDWEAGVSFRRTDKLRLDLKLFCENMGGFLIGLDVETAQGFKIYREDTVYNCNFDEQTVSVYKFNLSESNYNAMVDWIDERRLGGEWHDIKHTFIKKISLRIIGTYRSDDRFGFDDSAMKARDELLYISQPMIGGQYLKGKNKETGRARLINRGTLVFKDTLRRYFPEYFHLIKTAPENPFVYEVF